MHMKQINHFINHVHLNVQCMYMSQQAEEEGEDYERVKLLEDSATELERRGRKKKKKNPDTGFAGMHTHYLHV